MMILNRLLSTFFICVFYCLTIVQKSNAQTENQDGASKISILAGHTIDPKSEKVLQNQLITINDGIITELKSVKTTVLKSDSTIIDLSNHWVLPGLMDAHVHITWNVDYGKPNWNDTYVYESTAFRALRGAKVAKEFLYGGFTTIKEIGNDLNYATADVIKGIELGWFEGPTIQYVGKIIAPFGGQSGRMSPFNKEFWHIDFIDADTPDEMIKAVRQNIYFGATAIKLVTDQYTYHHRLEEIHTAVEEAARANMKVTVHAMGGDAAKAVILAGAAAIEHGFDLDRELLELMKEHGTYLVPTDFSVLNFMGYGSSRENAENKNRELAERLKLAHEIGVPLAYGTDIVINLPNKNRLESSWEVLKTWKLAKIPPMDILKAMTADAADLMDFDESVGQIKQGYVADLIAVSENPLENIDILQEVNFVMKHGRIVKR